MHRTLPLVRGVTALTVAALLPAGCTSKAPPDFVRTHLDDRLRSVVNFSGPDFPAGDPRAYVTLRTVFVISSGRPVPLIPNPKGPWADGPMLVHPYTGIAGSGVGVPVDRRGYILTANHVLVDPRTVRVVRTDGSRILIETARIVWRGSTARGEPDLAVLFVPGGLNQVYEWSQTTPSAGSVLGIGKSWTALWQHTSEFRFQAYAGTALGWEKAPGTLPWQKLTHNAPAFPGDSGGPLLNGQGKLLAISTHGGLRYDHGVIQVADATAYGIGARPDLAWLAQLIESDAQAHPTSE